MLSGICVAENKDKAKTINREKRLQAYKIEINIAKATVAWLQKQNKSDRLEATQQIDLLLEQDELGVKSSFVAAQAANLCGDSQKAISILEDVISKHPEDKAPDMNLPVKIMGRFWVATIAKQSNDIPKAKSNYDLILEEATGKIEGKEMLDTICNLYLSEIASEHLRKKNKALAKLEKAKQTKRPTPQDWAELYDFYSDWIGYEINKNTQGASEANKKLITDPKKMEMGYMAAMHQLSVVGLTDLPLSDYIQDDTSAILLSKIIEKTIKSKASPIDKDMMQLIAGYLKERAKKYTEAEKYYSDLYKENSFFSPIAGIALARCMKANNKNAEADKILKELKTKYPGYSSVADKLKKNPKSSAP